MAKNAAKPFVHLHLHSQYSLLDGGNRLDRLIKQVAELGMDAVAVTDHGNLFGAVDFYTKAKAAGIKPILGIEAYVAPDLDGKPSDRTCKEYTGVADGGFHLVLLAENQTGWGNLLKLTSDSYVNGFYYKPRMDKSTLMQWSEGLIAINGHLGSSIAHHLVKFEQTKDPAHYEQAKREAQWHAEVFKPNEKGEPCFYLELQSHEEKLQEQINPHTIKLARELDLPLVCDNDAHFLTADDWDAHDTLCCISMGKIKSDPSRLHYPRDLYVKSPQEMHARFIDQMQLPEAIENTTKIADRCNVELDFEANHAPVVRIETDFPRLPDGADDAIELLNAFECEHAPGSTDWFKAVSKAIRVEPFNTETDSDSPDDLKVQCDGGLRLLAEAGAIWRYGPGGMDEAKRARMERELQVLADKLISAYFMIVWDFVNEARSRGIPSNARGSGVGTMVGYVLGLSNACPVEYGLLFERFTDPDRTEYPDIDIDMCQDGRGEIIQYVRDRYGHVAQIITFGTLKARAAIRDVGRVIDLPLPEVDKLCKLIGDGLGTTLDKALEQEPELRELHANSPVHREVLDTARKLEGMTRHAGVHAAGVVVATQPLDNIIPLYQPPGTDQLVTQWDGPTTEKVGLLKMDFLGLRTLSIIERAKKLVRQSLDESTIRQAVLVGSEKALGDNSNPDTRTPIPDADPLDLDRLSYDNPYVLELFARGETAGVFQFESGGMRNLLMAMKPDRLTDLIAANALYRPGPMELIPNYNNRKHGREQVPKVHEVVDHITSETYGIMVYQEQVMQVLNELGGIPLRAAYSIIKAISKKKEKTINAAREDFVVGAKTRGVEPKQSNELFDLILKFAGYGFNKSHSTGYAIVAYQTAYLKTFFPIQYMAAVLTYESVSTEKVVEYIDECRRVLLPNGERGIEVRPPDINLSDIAFTVVFDKGEPRNASHGHIRFGMSAVKGVGEKAIRAILEERKKSGPYVSLSDFCERMPQGAVNRACIEALIKCGAFDTLHGIDARAAMVEGLESAIRAGSQAANLRSSEDFLFGAVDAAERENGEREDTFKLPDVPAWSRPQLLKHEKDVIGFYVSSHPLDEHRDALWRYSTVAVSDMREFGANTPVLVGGMLTRVRKTNTKKGDSMAILTLEDKSGPIDAVVFPKTYDKCSALLESDAIVFLEGKIDRRREEPNIIVDRVIPIEDASRLLTRAVKIIVEDPTPADQGAAFNGEFADVSEILRQATRRGEKRDAEVYLELRQDKQAVTVRLTGLRVCVDDHLVNGITNVLGRCTEGKSHCELVGQPRLRVSQSNQYKAEQDTQPKLAMTSNQQGEEVCASVDRY